MRYMLNQVFLNNGSQLVQVPKLLNAKAMPYDFGYWYADTAAVLTLCLVFGMASPFVLLLGALFFRLKRVVDNYNLTHGVVDVEFESEARFGHAAGKLLLLGTSLFLFVQSGYIALQASTELADWAH